MTKAPNGPPNLKAKAEGPIQSHMRSEQKGTVGAGHIWTALDPPAAKTRDDALINIFPIQTDVFFKKLKWS